jgi:hypothetical protein
MTEEGSRSPAATLPRHLDGDGAKFFEHLCKLKLEGIVSKRRGPTQRVGQSAGWYKSFPRIDRLAAIFRLDMPPARSRSTSRILRMGNLCPGIVTNTRSRTAIKRQTHADIADLDWRRLEHSLLHVIELAPSRDRICNCANSQ